MTRICCTLVTSAGGRSLGTTGSCHKSTYTDEVELRIRELQLTPSRPSLWVALREFWHQPKVCLWAESLFSKYIPNGTLLYQKATTFLRTEEVGIANVAVAC